MAARPRVAVAQVQVRVLAPAVGKVGVAVRELLVVVVAVVVELAAR
jgi:hypothetical protein